MPRVSYQKLWMGPENLMVKLVSTAHSYRMCAVSMPVTFNCPNGIGSFSKFVKNIELNHNTQLNGLLFHLFLLCGAVLHNAYRCCSAYLFVIFSFFTLGNFSFQLFSKLQMKSKWMNAWEFCHLFFVQLKSFRQTSAKWHGEMKLYSVNFGIQQFRHSACDEWRRSKSNIFNTELNAISTGDFFFHFFLFHKILVYTMNQTKAFVWIIANVCLVFFQVAWNAKMMLLFSNKYIAYGKYVANCISDILSPENTSISDTNFFLYA